MIDPSPKLRPPQMLDSLCARNPRRFSWLTGAAAAGAIAVWVLAMLCAVWWVGSGIHALAAGAGGSTPWAVLRLLLGGYLLGTGWKALRRVPADPSGPALSREAAPRLFHLLGKLAAKAGMDMPRDVVLGTEMRVFVSLQARWGWLGGHRATLVVGLPVLMALDVKQFAAVVTHALAHDRHARLPFGAWLGRMRDTWQNLAARQSVAATPPRRAWQLFGEGLAGCFLRLVFPWINARALALSRHRAFSADKAARRVAGSQSLVDALARMAVQRSYLEQVFWPEVLGRASHAPTPNVLPYRAMGQRMRMAKGHPKAQEWLASALQADAQAGDTHPSLRDRLARTDRQARLVPPPRHSAAELLLREALDPLVVEMDMRWQLDMAARWGRLHVEHVAQHRLEKELQVDGEKGALHPDDHLLWARAARSTQGEAAFEALLRLMLIDHPDDACARHELGSLLVDKTEAEAAAEGAQLLRELALGPLGAQSLPAARRYGRWLALQGGPSRDAPFWADEVRRIEHLAQEAQSALLDFDDQAQSFGPPALSNRMLRRLSEVLAQEPSVEQAHLATRKLVDFPAWRFAVLLVSGPARKRGGPVAVQAARLQGMVDALNLPSTVLVVDIADPAWASPQRRALAERIMKTPGAPLLERGGEAAFHVSSAAPTTAAPASRGRYMPA